LKDNKLWVVIPAAGSGQRMQSALPKQYLTLNGKTILEHTLSVFLRRDDIEKVVVCLARDDQVWPTLACANEPKLVTQVGGATRADSVLNGLSGLPDSVHDDDWVLVHDAARPCLHDDVLQRLIEQLSEDNVGGILAIPAKDTLKQSSSDLSPRVESTLDRSLVWQAQTPQMFRYKLLKDALNHALNSNIDITDEASALESTGKQPRLIEGDARNIKVTTPDDLVFAEFLLKK